MADIRKVTDLQPDKRNANKGTERGLKALDHSLRQYGAGRSLLVDKHGRIIAGNKTAQAAADIGLDDVILVQTDGTKLVAVQRTDLDLEQDKAARELAYADNRVGQLDLDFDVSVILEDVAAGVNLDALWRPDEVEALVQAAGKGLEDEPIADAPRVYSDADIIEAAFAYFRATGFPYRRLPVHVSMQEINKLAETEADKLINTDTAYHVADTYHPHRFHAAADGMKSPHEAFEDDGLLRRAMRLALEHGYVLPEHAWGHLWIVSGVQAASNFRPGFASFLYRRFCKPGDTVLDTSTGYGGRLVGFMASGIAGRYIGIDPNKPTHDGNTRMASELGFADKVELYNSAAEDVPHEAVAGRCDFAFTSPPYFAKEHYSEDDTQSWVRYKTGEAWRSGFLVPMMALQYAALKPGAHAIVNIADVKVRGKVYPLVEWTKAAALQVGFEYVRTDAFTLTRRFGAGMKDEVASEPVLVFKRL